MTQTAAASVERESRKAPVGPVLHIGYKRTGTSFLQTRVFSLVAQPRPMAVHEASAKIADAMPWRNFDTAYFNDDVFIYSDEGILSSVDADLTERVPEIARSFSGVRVVITVRSQLKLFRAFYFLHVKGGGTENFRQFVTVRLGTLFQFKRVVSEFQTALGTDRVHVILHEDLVAQPRQTIMELFKFAGCDPQLAKKVEIVQVKASPLDLTMRALRLRNRILASLAKLVGERCIANLYAGGLPGSRLLNALCRTTGVGRFDLNDILPLIDNTFARDNAALFKALGKDITAYDYPQPKHKVAT